MVPLVLLLLISIYFQNILIYRTISLLIPYIHFVACTSRCNSESFHFPQSDLVGKYWRNFIIRNLLGAIILSKWNERIVSDC